MIVECQPSLCQLIRTCPGIDQVVPARLVEGAARRITRVKQAALFNVVALTLTFAALGLTWASVGSSRMRATWHLSGLAIALLCVMFVNVANVGTSILRSHGDIGGITRWFVIQGLIGSGLGLVLMFWLGRWGLLWGWFAGCLVALLFVVRRGRGVFPLWPAPALECFDLLQVGLPLFVFSASSIVMRNLDRIVVLRFLGTQALGYYGLRVATSFPNATRASFWATASRNGFSPRLQIAEIRSRVARKERVLVWL